MTRPAPIITDHAMLRYLERVVGIDVAMHRREVELRVSQAVELGASALVSEGFRYTICDFRVTTVLPARPDLRRLPPFREVEDG